MYVYRVYVSTSCEVSTCKCSQVIVNFVHAKIPVAVLLCLIDYLIASIATRCWKALGSIVKACFLAALSHCTKHEITKNQSLGIVFRTGKGQCSLHWYIFIASAGAFIICSSRSKFMCICVASCLSFTA